MLEKYLIVKAGSTDQGYALFWKSNSCGYTPDINDAKLFTLEDAKRIKNDDYQGKYKIVEYQSVLDAAKEELVRRLQDKTLYVKTTDDSLAEVETNE